MLTMSGYSTINDPAETRCDFDDSDLTRQLMRDLDPVIPTAIEVSTPALRYIWATIFASKILPDRVEIANEGKTVCKGYKYSVNLLIPWRRQCGGLGLV